MNQRVKRTQKDYSPSFKQAVVDQVEAGELSCHQAQHGCGIQGRSTVLNWLRRYNRQDWHAGTPDHAKRSTTMATPLTPEQRIKELEQKAQFFQAVVDVMEKDYGVSVNSSPVSPHAKTCCRIILFALTPICSRQARSR